MFYLFCIWEVYSIEKLIFLFVMFFCYFTNLNLKPIIVLLLTIVYIHLHYYTTTIDTNIYNIYIVHYINMR